MDEQIPDAQTAPDDNPAFPADLQLGEPFAISYGCDLVQANEHPGAGCAAVVKCDCSQLFRVNLLDGEEKRCPGCNAGFTHALLIAPTRDTQIVAAAMAVVLNANGVEIPGLNEGDDDDDQDDDDQDDDDQDDDDSDQQTTLVVDPPSGQ